MVKAHAARSAVAGQTTPAPAAFAPERAALRQAIARHAEAQQRAVQITAAQRRVDAAAFAAFTELQRATAALAEAKANESRLSRRRRARRG